MTADPVLLLANVTAFYIILNLLDRKGCGREGKRKEAWEVQDVSAILVREGSREKQHLGLCLDEPVQIHKQIPSGRSGST